MQQRRQASGNTTVSRVKSLLLHVQKHRGRAEADAFLLKTRVGREYIDDETQPLPLEVWHRALEAFVNRWGRDEVSKTVDSVVHIENLGVWTRVLRGTSDPRGAFCQLSEYGGGEVLTERWTTLEEAPGRWVGRIWKQNQYVDDLFALARSAELAAVPVLFGLAPGRVRLVSTEERSGALIAEDYEVTWEGATSLPNWWAVGLSGITGAAAGLFLDAGVVVFGPAGLFGGAALSALSRLERRRRAQSRAQLLRIQVLERAAALKDAREHGAAGYERGSVVAGQYKLGKKLGVGASGAIWEAERLADGAIVAVKLLRAAVAHDTVASDRLRREAAALGLAWHPNVVEVFDDGHLPDGTGYLVMERLYGESLAERLKRVGVLSPEELLPLALQVCEALGAVHAAGVVHRDLKPSNIFLAKSESSDYDLPGNSIAPMPHGERVKLLDFGVARVEWAETRITNIDGPLGTPGYMSPEQEMGAEIDPRTDLFALGGVLFECLTGTPPSVQSSGPWLVSQAFDANFESGVMPSSQNLAPQWRPIIERAMARLPSKRFPDARAVADALLDIAAPGVLSSQMKH